MPRTMIRFLVTLLVLISGLSAEGMACEPRAYGSCAEVGVVETRQGATRAVPCAVAGGSARMATTGPRIALVVAHPAALVLPVPAVLTGIDRARE